MLNGFYIFRWRSHWKATFESSNRFTCHQLLFQVHMQIDDVDSSYMQGLGRPEYLLVVCVSSKVYATAVDMCIYVCECVYVRISLFLRNLISAEVQAPVLATSVTGVSERCDGVLIWAQADNVKSSIVYQGEAALIQIEWPASKQEQEI